MARKLRVEAKDVEAAISQGLRELGLRRDQAEITVVAQPTKGFLGIGAKPAVVMITKKHWGTNLDSQIYMDVPKKKSFDKPSRNSRNKKADGRPAKEDGAEEKREERAEGRREGGRGGRRDDKRGGKKFDKRGGKGRGRERFAAEEPLEPLTPKVSKEHEPQLLPNADIQSADVPENLKAPMEEAKQMLSKVLSFMGVQVTNLNVWWDAKQSRILITFDCDSPSIVIGKDGKTLEAIQYLITLSLSRQFDTNISVITDTQNYWRKTEDKLESEANKALDAIKRGMSVYRLRPMASQMRRYIHRALANSELVETISEGEGKWRKVVVKAKSVASKATDVAQAAAQSTAEKVSEVAHNTVDKVSEAAHSAAEDFQSAASEVYNTVKEEVKDIASTVAETADNVTSAALEKVIEAEEKAEEYLENKLAEINQPKEENKEEKKD